MMRLEKLAQNKLQAFVYLRHAEEHSKFDLGRDLTLTICDKESLSLKRKGSNDYVGLSVAEATNLYHALGKLLKEEEESV
jgi:hypothetical protein